MLQQRYAEAIEWSNRVYAYDKNSTWPAELQLDIHETTGDWESALQVALQLTREYPNNAGYVRRLARVYVQLGEREPQRRQVAVRGFGGRCAMQLRIRGHLLQHPARRCR